MLSARSYYFFLLLLLCSNITCKQKPTTSTPAVNKQFPTFSTKGKVISADSLASPRVYKMKALKGIPSGPPTTLPIINHGNIIKDLEIKSFINDNIKIPGQDGCKLPKDVQITRKTTKASLPDKIVLNEPDIAWEGDKYITAYMENHGVRPGGVNYMMEDKTGNLWMCSNLTGIIKFDGRHLNFYTEKHGLAGNGTYQIIEGKNDDFWIATNLGMSYFDGIEFTNYFFAAKNHNGNSINSLVLDDDGHLWIASLDGLYKMNLETGTCLRFDTDSGLLHNSIKRMLKDTQGRIWMSYINGGLSLLDIKEDQKSLNTFIHFSDDSNYFADEVKGIYEDVDHDMWIATSTGALIISDIANENFRKCTITKINQENGLAGDHILSIEQDTVTKEMYLSINKTGVSILNKKDGEFHHRNLATQRPYRYAYLMRDRKNDIWSSSEFGFSKITNNPFNLILLKTEKLTYSPTKITEDKWGRTWFATYGTGIFLYEPESQNNPAKLHQYNTSHGMSSGFVDEIIADKKGNLWIGLRDYGLIKMELNENSLTGVFKNYLEKNDFPAGFVPNMILDKNDDLWCTLYEYGTQPTAGICRVRDDEILHVGIDQGLIHDDTWELDQDDERNLWVGSARNGLTKFQYTSDTTAGKVVQFTLNDHLLGLRIWSLIADRESNIWTGANGGEGLVKISASSDGPTYAVTQFTKSEGLLNNDISAIHEDKSGNIWVGSKGGLNQLKTNTDHSIDDILNYTPLDGLPNAGVFFNGIHQSPDSTIWIRTNSNLVNFKPQDLKVDYGIPQVLLNDVLVYNERVEWKKDTTFQLRSGIEISDCRYDSLSRWEHLPENLSLRHDNNFLSFEFTGISITAPHRLLYSYQLEGWSDRWSLESKDNVAVFGTLRPGSYTFKVKSKYKQGEWSQPIEYSFTIRPPWWKSIWAYLLYIAALIGGIALFIRMQIRRSNWKISLLEKVRTNISLDLHDDVGTIMSGVAMQAEFLAAAEPEDIKAEMTQISEMSREAIEKMRDIVWALDPRKDKFENLIDRMHSFAEVMLGNSNFDYEFKVKDVAGEKFISPELRRNIYLIFKEAIQNIYKHSNGNKVNISLGRNNQGFSLSIFDNGRSTTTINSDGLGISNMRLRAQKVGAVFQIEKKDGFTILLNFGKV